jgi:hypothetical protein
MKPLAVLAVCLFTSTIHAEELRILAWNVESGGNDPNVIVNQLHELSDYDIVGLTEVRASSIKKYVDALSASGNTFLSINTATGGGDPHTPDKYSLLTNALDHSQVVGVANGRSRSPCRFLAVRLIQQ